MNKSLIRCQSESAGLLLLDFPTHFFISPFLFLIGHINKPIDQIDSILVATEKSSGVELRRFLVVGCNLPGCSAEKKKKMAERLQDSKEKEKTSHHKFPRFRFAAQMLAGA